MLDPHDFVVVAGIPGAGKSTLLDHADNRAQAVILDSDQMRHRMAELMPGWLAYRWYRPLVHLAHRLRIALCAVRAPGPVVAHEPATRATTRALLIVIGVLARRTRRFLWISADPEDARRGQVERGRVIRRRSFARHVLRAHSVESALVARRHLRGWHSVRLLRRPKRGSPLVLLPSDRSPAEVRRRADVR